MNNNYQTCNNVTKIFLNDSSKNLTGEVMIDSSDLEKVKGFPNTWRLQHLKNRAEVRGTYKGKE